MIHLDRCSLRSETAERNKIFLYICKVFCDGFHCWGFRENDTPCRVILYNFKTTEAGREGLVDRGQILDENDTKEVFYVQSWDVFLGRSFPRSDWNLFHCTFMALSLIHI